MAKYTHTEADKIFDAIIYNRDFGSKTLQYLSNLKPRALDALRVSEQYLVKSDQNWRKNKHVSPEGHSPLTYASALWCIGMDKKLGAVDFGCGWTQDAQDSAYPFANAAGYVNAIALSNVAKTVAYQGEACQAFVQHCGANPFCNNDFNKSSADYVLPYAVQDINQNGHCSRSGLYKKFHEISGQKYIKYFSAFEQEVIKPKLETLYTHKGFHLT